MKRILYILNILIILFSFQSCSDDDFEKQQNLFTTQDFLELFDISREDFTSKYPYAAVNKDNYRYTYIINNHFITDVKNYPLVTMLNFNIRDYEIKAYNFPIIESSYASNTMDENNCFPILQEIAKYKDWDIQILAIIGKDFDEDFDIEEYNELEQLKTWLETSKQNLKTDTDVKEFSYQITFSYINNDTDENINIRVSYRYSEDDTELKRSRTYLDAPEELLIRFSNQAFV